MPRKGITGHDEWVIVESPGDGFIARSSCRPSTTEDPYGRYPQASPTAATTPPQPASGAGQMPLFPAPTRSRSMRNTASARDMLEPFPFRLNRNGA